MLVRVLRGLLWVVLHPAEFVGLLVFALPARAALAILPGVESWEDGG